jgi:3',5'-cyclic-AMP phosphodiesterase
MTVVLQLSDTHLSRVPHGDVNGRDPDERLATVLAAWQALGEQADLVLLTGDLADDGSREGCERLAAAVSALGAPMLALPGNHDVPGVVSDAFTPAAQLCDLGAWRVVGFDTSRPEQVHGTLDVAAALALIDGLDDRPTLVALHHPPVSRSSNPWFQLDGAQELLAGLGTRPQVKIVASGHLHDAFEFEGPGGVALLGCPSTLLAIGHDGEAMELGADAPTGARVLRLEDDGDWASTVLVA